MAEDSFESVLERDGKLIYTNVGDSMLPLIREGRDLLVIEKAAGPLKRLDIPLYRRSSGQYVLHRVLQVRSDGYVLCGVNRRDREYGVTDQQILGVLTAVIRGGKEISMRSPLCRLYAHLWCDFFPLRVLLLRARSFLRRL